MLHTFVFIIKMPETFRKPCKDEEENEIEIKIEIENRVAANRAINALLKGTKNEIIATYAEN